MTDELTFEKLGVMKYVDLGLNTSLELVGLDPLKLTGRCVVNKSWQDFMIIEVDDGYFLTDWAGYEETFSTLKEALMNCWMEWGDFDGAVYTFEGITK